MEIKGTKEKYRCSREQKENMCVCAWTHRHVQVCMKLIPGSSGTQRGPGPGLQPVQGLLPCGAGPGSLMPCMCHWGGLLNLSAPQLPQPLSKGA